MNLMQTQTRRHMDSWGRPIKERSPHAITSTLHVFNLMQPSAVIPHQNFLKLDLSDPLQYQFFMERFGVIEGHPLGPYFPNRAELAAHMARTAKAPQAPSTVMLHALRAPSDTYQPVALITVFDYDAAQPEESIVTAGGIVSVPNGAKIIDTLIEIYEGPTPTGTPIAQGAGAAYGAYTLCANATGKLTTPKDKAVALLSGQFVDIHNNTVPFAVSQALGPVPSLKVTVQDPVHKVTKAPNPITVALGRKPNSSTPSDTDYYYNGSKLELPIKGSAVPESPTVLFDPGQQVTGSLTLVKQNGASAGGGVVVVYPNEMAPACTVTPQSLSWSLDPADFNQTPPWTPGDVIQLNLNLTATMADASKVNITVTSDQSGNLPEQQPLNTAFIDSLQFYWGCLAAETPITLADGSLKTARDVRIGDQVRGRDGQPLTVYGVKTGVERKPMIAIETVSGNRLLTTDGHPILTEAGVKAARSIERHDRIAEAEGFSEVLDVSEVSYDGVVYNLMLRDAAGELPDQAVFLASGMFVGDNAMQTRVEQDTVTQIAREKARELVKAMRGWELDIENHRRALAKEPLLSKA